MGIVLRGPYNPHELNASHCEDVENLCFQLPCAESQTYAKKNKLVTL